MKAITKRMTTLAMSLLCASSLAASASAEIGDISGINSNSIIETSEMTPVKGETATPWGVNVPTALHNLSSSDYEGY